jgi:hypothetical protein
MVEWTTVEIPNIRERINEITVDRIVDLAFKMHDFGNSLFPEFCVSEKKRRPEEFEIDSFKASESKKQKMEKWIREEFATPYLYQSIFSHLISIPDFKWGDNTNHYTGYKREKIANENLRLFLKQYPEFNDLGLIVRDNYEY